MEGIQSSSLPCWFPSYNWDAAMLWECTSAPKNCLCLSIGLLDDWIHIYLIGFLGFHPPTQVLVLGKPKRLLYIVMFSNKLDMVSLASISLALVNAPSTIMNLISYGLGMRKPASNARKSCYHTFPRTVLGLGGKLAKPWLILTICCCARSFGSKGTLWKARWKI